MAPNDMLVIIRMLECGLCAKSGMCLRQNHNIIRKVTYAIPPSKYINTIRVEGLQ